MRLFIACVFAVVGWGVALGSPSAASPQCGGTCQSDSDCAAGGSSCGSCVIVPVNRCGGSTWICVRDVELPLASPDVQSVNVGVGEYVYASSVMPANQTASTYYTTNPCFVQCNSDLYPYFYLKDSMGTSNCIITNLIGPAGVGFETPFSFVLRNVCGYNSSFEYYTSLAPYPTDALQIRDRGQYVVGFGDMLTFPLNGVNAVIDTIKHPFVVTMGMSFGCTMVPGLASYSSFTTFQIVPQLVNGVAFYGTPDNTSSWIVMGYVYVPLGTSCALNVTTEYLPMVDFSTNYTIAFSYPSTPQTYSVDGYPGVTVFGNYTAPNGVGDGMYCLTVVGTPAGILDRWGVIVNGNRGQFYPTQNVDLFNVTLGLTARVDIVDYGDGPSSGVAYIVGTPGACAGVPTTKMGIAQQDAKTSKLTEVKVV